MDFFIEESMTKLRFFESIADNNTKQNQYLNGFADAALKNLKVNDKKNNNWNY